MVAAIAITACTVSQQDVGAWKILQIETPSTIDDGDTIDVSSLFAEVSFGIASGATDGTIICATTANLKNLTIPGATDNETRRILVIGH